MTVLGIDLNDAALIGSADGELSFNEPGYALAPDGELMFGWDAWRAARRYPRRVQNRYWAELADELLPTELAGARTAADLVHGHLETVWQRAGGNCDGVSFAVPAYWDTPQLGLLLGIAEELGIPVLGFVDASIAASRREYPERELIDLQPSLHSVALTRVTQAGKAALGQRELLPGLGIEALERSCVQFFASGFLNAARFDPLHDAATEQYLYDQLEGWLESLVHNEKLQARVNYQGNDFAAEFAAEDLALRLAERWQPLLQRVRSLLTADTQVALQLPAGLDRFPGLLRALAELSGVEVFTLEQGAVARGAVRRSVLVSARDGLRLLTALPWDEAAAQAPAQSSRAAAAEQATHLLAGAHAYRLDAGQTFFVGTELVAGGYGVQVDSRVAGVSRQHCSIQQDGGRLVLTDHSRFGTQLNGHGIDGSAVLQAGDVIAVGSPPRQFHLIAEVDADGA